VVCSLLVHICITFLNFLCTFIFAGDALGDLEDPENKDKVGYEEKKTVFKLLQWLIAINCLTVLIGIIRSYFGFKMFQFYKNAVHAVTPSAQDTILRRAETESLNR